LGNQHAASKNAVAQAGTLTENSFWRKLEDMTKYLTEK